MKRLLPSLLIALLFAIPAYADGAWPEIKWEALVPKGWNPAREFKGLDLSKLDDADPRAIEALDKLKKLWDTAPTEATLEGRKVRIAGFALPLERDAKGATTEYLIVPYFGACIHTPPPPANQIIHARSAKGMPGVRLMVPIWSYGTLSVKRSDTTWGVAGYRLQVDQVTPYEEPTAKQEAGRDNRRR